MAQHGNNKNDDRSDVIRLNLRLEDLLRSVGVCKIIMNCVEKDFFFRWYTLILKPCLVQSVRK